MISSMRIFAVGRENLDRFNNTNSRKFVDQRSLMGSREGGGGRLTSLSRDDESKRRWKGNWIILTNILVTKVSEQFFHYPPQVEN